MTIGYETFCYNYPFHASSVVIARRVIKRPTPSLVPVAENLAEFGQFAFNAPPPKNRFPLSVGRATRR